MSLIPAGGKNRNTVRPLADKRVRNRVHNQRDEDRKGDKLGPNPDSLIIVEQQERPERDVLDAVADRAGAIEELGQKPELGCLEIG